MKILILLILPGTIAAFHLLRRYNADAAAWLVLVASLGIYATVDRAGLPLLLCSILFNYWISGRIYHSVADRRWWSAAGIVANLLPLLFYKYLRGPAPVSAAGLFVVAGIPLGLSFYTFQQITALLDIQRVGATRLTFHRHALFTAFFPQIPSGPVSRYRDLAPQLAQLGHWRVDLTTVLAGFSLFVVGLGKKTFLADPLGDTVNAFHALVAAGQPLSLLEAWFSAWTFVLQIYFDFSGYSDMALGIALCFGIVLPANFNSPLKAKDAPEFVSKWHMSLVNWIKEYLFQPTYDAVRKVSIQSRHATRTAAWALATIISMTVIGAWHGSQVGLILEGFLAGSVIVVTQLVKRRGKRRPRAEQQGFKLGSRIQLMMIVSTLMLALRAGSMHALLLFLRSMVDVRSLLPASLAARLHVSLATGMRPGLMPHGMVTGWNGIYVLVAMAIVYTLPNSMQIFGLIAPREPSKHGGEAPPRLLWSPSLRWGFAVGGLALLELVFNAGRGQGFIYAAF